MTFFHKRTEHGPNVVPVTLATVHAMMVLDYGAAWLTSFSDSERATIIDKNFEAAEWPYGYGVAETAKPSRKQNADIHPSDSKRPHLSLVRKDD